MIIGFTGTQLGITLRQHGALEEQLVALAPTEVRHGDCIGADAQFSLLVRRVDKDIKIILHPPSNSSKRAFCDADVILPPANYLVRNHAIVDASDLLIVCPKVMEMELRSGTWATYRYAKKVGRPRIVIYPDGSVVKRI